MIRQTRTRTSCTHLGGDQCLLLHESGQRLLYRGDHDVGEDGGEAATGADLVETRGVEGRVIQYVEAWGSRVQSRSMV